MNWIKTFRQFFSLLMLVTLLLSMVHGCLNLIGKSQHYTRIEHPVLNKISDIIYLRKNNGSYVFAIGNTKTASKTNALPEISNMKYFKFDPTTQTEDLKAIGHNTECLFIEFEIEDKTQKELDQIIELLGPRNCVFFQTKYLKMKSYFAFKNPRWFFNLMTVELQKSRFLSSLGLESVSTLNGDFIVLGTPETNIPHRLLKEIKRRDIIVFIKSEFN